MSATTAAKSLVAARKAELAGHRRDGEGTWSHEAYEDPAYGQLFCQHCDEYLGEA